MDDEWELRRVRVPKGTHLSKSKDSEGAQRDLLREDGTNKLLGPAESMAVEEDDPYYDDSYVSTSSTDEDEQRPSWVAEAMADIIDEVVDSIDWDYVFEHIVVPAAKRTKDRIANRFRSTFGWPKTEIVPFVPETPASPGKQVATEVEGPAFSLTLDEYRERVIAALAAEAFAARQREIIANSRIEGEEVPAELLRAITLVLEGNASSLAEDELAAVMDFLQEARTAAQPYPLPRIHEIDTQRELPADE